MKKLLTPLAFLVLIALVALTANVHRHESKQRELENDRVVIAHISYGLFNIDEWKAIVAEIVTRKIDEFEVTDDNREEVRQKAEEILHAIVDEIELLMRERNKKSLSGIFKQFMTDLLFSFDELRQDIPTYAEVIVERLDDPETKKAMKAWIINKITELADATVGEMDYTTMNEVLERYGCNDKLECLDLLTAYRQDVRADSRLSVMGLSACVLVLLVLIFVGQSRGAYIAFCLSAGVLLFAGITLPMIDIEATITHFAFALMGEPITFDNQVIFYQSKSILEVIQVLLINGDVALIVVSFLIFAFSVLLPLAKLALSLEAAIRRKAPQGKVSTFLVYQSGKWSMADVMVVALFMAYIGFSGVINNQLTQIERGEASLEVFTTNNSTLRLGFYLFTAYALSGLLLSTRLPRILADGVPQKSPEA